MDSEFWSRLLAEAWSALSEIGSLLSEWAASDTGTVTLLGIAAGLIAGWTVARMYFRRLRRELDALVKRLETGTVHLETSIDRIQAEIVVANQQLEELLKKQSTTRPRQPPRERFFEPMPDLGNDWALVGKSAEDADAADDDKPKDS